MATRLSMAEKRALQEEQSKMEREEFKKTVQVLLHSLQEKAETGGFEVKVKFTPTSIKVLFVYKGLQKELDSEFSEQWEFEDVSSWVDNTVYEREQLEVRRARAYALWNSLSKEDKEVLYEFGFTA